MEDIICPFCVDKDVSLVCEVENKKTGKKRPLYKCENLGGFFWGDTKERVQELADMCRTRFLYPEKCIEDVLIYFPPHEYRDSTLDDVKELDIICASCKLKDFIIR